MENTITTLEDYRESDIAVSLPPAEFISPFPPQDVSALLGKPEPVWKRLVDITVSAAGIILISPLLLLVAVMIKVTSKGTVLFCQQRAGFRQKPFTMYKFRSMFENAEEKKKDLMQYNERSGPAFKMTNDPRVTPVGKIIRKWSLDELPQLFNVLRGDMSLVGPRPLPVNESRACEPWQKERLDVKPGITCIWQAKARHVNNFADWARLDIEYIRKMSFWFDMKILFSTIPAIINKKGAY